MAKVNTCLKVVFVAFNVLFAFAGGLLFALGIFADHYYYPRFDQNVSSAIHCIYGVGAITVGLSILGAYGAAKEKKWALILFLLAMLIGGIALLWIGVPLVPLQSQVRAHLGSYFKEMIPLDKAESNSQNTVIYFQTTYSCCGLIHGYQDWGNSIPESCKCSSIHLDTPECQRVTVTTRGSYWYSQTRSSVVQVYRQPCGHIFLSFVDKAFHIILGLFFGFAAVAFIGLIISLILLLQISSLD